MTNFEKFKQNLKKERFINMLTMDCRFCPISEETNKNCYCLSRTDCQAKLNSWCDKEVK